METCISGSGRVSVSGRNSISGIMPIPRPSRALHLVTIAEVGSARLTSLDRVTTGVGSVSQGARAKPNSLGRSLRLPLPEGAVSMTFCPKLLLTDNWKMRRNSGNDLRYDKYSAYHNTTLKTALSTGWRSNCRKPKPFPIYLFDQCSSAINDSSSSAFQLRSALGAENFYAAMTFATQTNVKFTKDIAKSFTDRRRSLLTLKMSNATLFKHFARRKWQFFTFTKRVSRRTMNLSIPNHSRDFCVPICRWDRVSTTRDIAV